MQLPKYSIGIGDRFAHQGPAQLDAILKAAEQGVTIAPVWNKSHREHAIVGSRPAHVRPEADRAVQTRRWTGPYFVDADHITLKTVDAFLDACDFFTLDVAEEIGKPAAEEDIAGFVARHRRYVGKRNMPGIELPLEISEQTIGQTARKYLAAVQEAGRIYRHIARRVSVPLAREEGLDKRDAYPTGDKRDAYPTEDKRDAYPTGVIEVSMDETDTPQTPAELLFILAALADEGVPAQTIAPRFSGRFNKGVDYVGDVARFAQEFEQNLAVIAFAVHEFGLPTGLKLSVHSGSDKFSLYGPIRRAIRKFDAGIHLKTAGTTWLEELIGLAEAGGSGLAIAKDIYAQALGRVDELCAPYASVININAAALPAVEAVSSWDGPAFAAALRHNQANPAYNPNLRQLLHVAYRVAAEMGERFTAALEEHADTIARNVTENLFERHIRPLFCS